MDSEEALTFCRKEGIDLLILFGSQATGKKLPGSDIDVAVKMGKGTKHSKLELIAALTDFFGKGEIDLVILTRDTDPLLLHEIYSKGSLIYEVRPGLFENEKLRAWHLYLDTEKLRRKQKEYLMEYARRAGNVT